LVSSIRAFRRFANAPCQPETADELRAMLRVKQRDLLSEYQGKAEALRKAMLRRRNTPDQPEYAHPAFCAPFVVIGEGG
jgi:hypothetical protein